MALKKDLVSMTGEPMLPPLLRVPPHFMQNYSWISWVMQFLLGLFVGIFVFGVLSWRVSRFTLSDGLWEHFYCGLAFTIGGGLFLGGLNAYYGDRMWMPRGIFDSAVPEKTKAANVTALTTSALGALMMVISIITIWTW